MAEGGQPPRGTFCAPRVALGAPREDFFREFDILVGGVRRVEGRARPRPTGSVSRVGLGAPERATDGSDRTAHPAPARAFSVFSGRGHRASSCHAEHTLPSTAGPMIVQRARGPRRFGPDRVRAAARRAAARSSGPTSATRVVAASRARGRRGSAIARTDVASRQKSSSPKLIPYPARAPPNSLYTALQRFHGGAWVLRTPPATRARRTCRIRAARALR